ncbi:helix-turn-helix domain-containing protein [Winogradskyella arenosi]|uniref:Excisionase family DNA binding protein n=1 Tax=Winogradskyella arenosi TaxID=533325 RepID=A0A368ZM27_9FLAO|nr:helix-turn-helix domain-containing protein [Winogradskyella arenosi]RCW93636.1 excisionase family DNA binding protein [Winogradskyella arenosi]
MKSNRLHFYQTTPEELTSTILNGVDNKLQEFFDKFLKSLNTEEDELLTIEEALKILKCSNQTLWNWRKAGIIPSHRIGNRIYIKRSDINAKLIKQN